LPLGQWNIDDFQEQIVDHNGPQNGSDRQIAFFPPFSKVGKRPQKDQSGEEKSKKVDGENKPKDHHGRRDEDGPVAFFIGGCTGAEDLSVCIPGGRRSEELNDLNAAKQHQTP
jgi:hypothetical protein